jgi:hypothetical protein
MTAVYDNKDFILFPLQQTKTVLKCCSTCKTLNLQFNLINILGTPFVFFLEPIVSHVDMTKMKNEKCVLKN